MTGQDETVGLIRSFHGGDSSALEVLIRENLKWVGDYVRRRLGQHLRGDAETIDFVQEAMIDVLEYGPRFEVADREQFRALLARIVENNLRDRQKWLQRHRRDAKRERGRATDTVLRLDAPVEQVTDPGDRAQKTESEEWIRLAMELLDPFERDLLWLRQWEEKPFEEIGQALGVSTDAARMRFNRALTKLTQKVVALKDGRLGRLLA